MSESFVDEYLVIQNGIKKIRPKGVLYVTDLTKPCLRSAYYGIVYEREYPISTQRIFESGKMIEDWWTDVLRRVPGVEILGTQVKARYITDELKIHGRVDILCQHSDGAIVAHEVKSAKSTFYVKEPKQSHLEQLQFYLTCLGLEFGQVDYLDKTVLLQGGGEESDRVDKTFKVKRDSAVFAELVGRAKKLMRCWEAEDPPVPTKGWLCDYCLFAEACKESTEMVL